MNWLDIFLLLILGGSVLKGLRSGLLGGLSRLLGFLLGLAAALHFYQPVADFIYLKWEIPSVGGLPFSANTGNTGFNPISPHLLLSSGPGEIVGNLGDSITQMLASGVLNILSFVIIFLAVSWGIMLLGTLLGTMAKLFFLGPVDRTAGALLGAVNGGILALILVGLLNSLQTPVSFIFSSQNADLISHALQHSTLVPFFTQALIVLNVRFPGWGI